MEYAYTCLVLYFKLLHKHLLLVTPKISGLARSWVIGYLSEPSSFLYVIAKYTFPDSHTDLFPARYILPDSI